MKPGLFTVTVETRRPTTRCTDLVPLPRDDCLACGGPTTVESVGQPALFRHGGYGATRMETFAICLARACRAVRLVRTVEVRPDRRGA